MRNPARWIATLLVPVALASALAPASKNQAAAPAPAAAPAAQPAAAQKPKTVTIAVAYEPKAVNEMFVQGQQFTDNNIKAITHDTLVRNAQYEVYEPGVATE